MGGDWGKVCCPALELPGQAWVWGHGRPSTRCRWEGRNWEDGLVPRAAAPLAAPAGTEMGGGVGTTRRRAGVMEGFPPRPSEQGLYPRDS